MSADGAVELIPYGADPLHALADRLLGRHSAELPDLSPHIVLLPQASAIPRFHQVLLDVAAERGVRALLPPAASTLAAWAARHSDPSSRILSETAREALFLEALQQHRELRRRFGTWPLIDSMLRFFDELTLERCQLPEDPEAFRRLIAEGYGSGSERLAPFGDEAALVYSLWRAWRVQLGAGHLLDRPLMLLDALARSVAQVPQTAHVYLAGFVDASRIELDWIRRMMDRGRVTLLLQGKPGETGPHPEAPVTHLLRELATATPAHPAPSAYTQLLDRAYANHETSLLARAHEQAQTEPRSPARGRLFLHESTDAEDEANAISLQVRRWRLAGKTELGIVTNDRRLARRVRALLERAGIGVEDAAGWALSTTSAATVLDRWLDCFERNFHHESLLDLLRSPFLSLGLPREHRAAGVGWFERHVVLGYNVRAGIRSYRSALERLRARVAESADAPNLLAGRTSGASRDTGSARGPRLGPIAAPDQVLLNVSREILQRLEDAMQPVFGVGVGGRRRGLEHCRALRQSLDALGLLAEYARDDAGREIIAVLDELDATLGASAVSLTWNEFVAWLQRTLERRRFQPRLRGAGVELMSFAESRLYHFDAVIIAGTNEEHLPGGLDRPPLFNDGVRARLGLPRSEMHYATRFYDFRRLLEAGDEVLVSWRRERDGETLATSPWVECLGAFHQLAYGDRLEDTELRRLNRSAETIIARHDMPRPPPRERLAARLPVSRMPEKLSASAHQSLIDCPYQFYCRYGLGLLPAGEVREEMEKSDYGQRVHRILQAFHSPVPGLPGPWREPLTRETLPAARFMMRQISEAVFADDLRQSLLTQGWLYRWLEVADEYLAWQLERSSTWKVEQTEADLSHEYAMGNVRVTLAGRIDRIDGSAQGAHSLIDYKTGASPKLEDVMAGEAVQLPTYALLQSQPVAETLYLRLGQDGLSDQVSVAGEELEALLEKIRERLLHIRQALDDGAELPAWGNDDTCAACNFMGLCRKQLWQPEPKASTQTL